MNSTAALKVFRIGRTLDGGAGRRYRHQLDKLALDCESGVLLDLSATELVHSAGLAALLTGLRSLAAHKIPAIVVCPNRSIRTVFEVCDARHNARLLDEFEDERGDA